MQIYRTFSELLADWSHSSAPALFFGNPISSISFSELSDLIRREADKIRSEKTVRRLIVTDHEVRTVVNIIACAIAGCDTVLADESLNDETLSAITKMVCPDSIHCSDSELYEYLCESRPKGRHISALPRHKDGEEGNLIFFTSGTTRQSKAVVLTPESLLRCTYSGQCMLACYPDDILLSVLPFSHVFGFVCGLLWGLVYGAAVALGRGSKYLLADCEHFRPTILPAVPSIINILVQRGCLNEELSTVLIGAAPLTTETMLALGSSGRKIYVGYGLTETSSGLAITQKLSEPNKLYPCPDVDICIEADGEISVTTPCMMEGYLSFAGKESFTPARGERLYTGDLGFLTRDGALVLTGRKKDLLILPDGTKIFCTDYEQILAPMIGTDDIALVLRDHKLVLIVGGMSSDHYQSIVNVVADFNSMKPQSERIYDVVLQDAPLPRTSAGKLRRWQVDPENAVSSANE